MLIIQCDTTVLLWRKRASVFDSRSPRILRGKPASGSSPLAGHSGWNLLLLSKEDFQAESQHCCHSTGTPTSPAQIEEKSKTCDTPSFILCQVALWRAIRRQICPICIYTTDSTSLSHEVNKQGVFYSSLSVDVDGCLVSFTCPCQTSPGTPHTYVPSGPAGPCPPYNTPGQPGAVRSLAVDRACFNETAVDFNVF